jgi:hypothetical protein
VTPAGVKLLVAAAATAAALIKHCKTAAGPLGMLLLYSIQKAGKTIQQRLLQQHKQQQQQCMMT